MKIAIFGLGYVGTVTAAGLASRGHEVRGVDVDPVKVELLRAGRSPVVEPGIDELIASTVEQGLLTATTDPVAALDRADVSLLCVGTPSKPQGGTDLVYLRRALDDIRHAMEVATPPDSGFHAVVVRSTVPPGTGDELVSPTFTDAEPVDGWEIGTAMCPEFLREGSGVADFFNPPMVVVGTANRRVADQLTEMLAFLDNEIRLVDVRTAEALKYACNAFHAVKVSFANELSRIFRTFDVDSREVMKVFTEDKVLNISPAYLMPGFAFGGSCLPKDLRALLDMARMNALDVPLLHGTLQTNELVIADVVDRLIASPYRTVAMLGLSFKMNTDDLRESPNVELAERLLGKGFEVRIYDPIVNPERLMGSNLRYIESRLPHLRRLLVATPAEALAGAEAAIVATSDGAALRGAPQRAARVHPRPARPPRQPTSSGCPPTKASGGPRDREQRADGPNAGPDHRPEPAGPLRPSGLAGEPGPGRGRLRRDRRLPQGQGRPGIPGPRRGHHLQVPPVRARRWGRSASSWSTRTRSSPRCCWCSAPGARAGSTYCRPATRRTSSGRSPGGCGSATVRGSSSTTTISAPSFSTPGSPTAAGWPAGGCWPWRRPPSPRPTTSSPRTPPTPRSRCGGAARRPTDVTVVRTGPDGERLRRRAANPAQRRGRRHLVAYIGVMGPQDGVDLAVQAAAYVVHDLQRTDVSFTFMGAGDSYDDLVALRDELGLQDYLELPGRVPDETVLDVLSTADVGLSPDPKNPLNDVSTMNKTMEYMAFGLPGRRLRPQGDPHLRRRRRYLYRER